MAAAASSRRSASLRSLLSAGRIASENRSRIISACLTFPISVTLCDPWMFLPFLNIHFLFHHLCIAWISSFDLDCEEVHRMHRCFLDKLPLANQESPYWQRGFCLPLDFRALRNAFFFSPWSFASWIWHKMINIATNGLQISFRPLTERARLKSTTWAPPLRRTTAFWTIPIELSSMGHASQKSHILSYRGWLVSSLSFL